MTFGFSLILTFLLPSDSDYEDYEEEDSYSSGYEEELFDDS